MGLKHNPRVVWRVLPCFGVVRVEGEGMSRGRAVTRVVGHEIHYLLPDLVLRVVIPLHQLSVLPAFSGPFIEDMGADEGSARRVQRFQFRLCRGGGGKPEAGWGLKGVKVILR